MAADKEKRTVTGGNPIAEAQKVVDLPLDNLLSLQDALTVSLRPPCAMCKGTGIVLRLSFGQPRRMLEQTCHLCHGKKWDWLPAPELTKMVEELRKYATDLEKQLQIDVNRSFCRELNKLNEV